MKTWDDETVVYDACSGNTHLLSADAIQVLATIMHAPADMAVLTNSLTDPASERFSGNAREKVGTILAELAAISLINSAAH